jgi:gliding motility-associated-like protein
MAMVLTTAVKIKFSDLEVGLSIQLFDRYGKFIKINSKQDGMLNGLIPRTDYWFVVTRSNGKNIEVILV